MVPPLLGLPCGRLCCSVLDREARLSGTTSESPVGQLTSEGSVPRRQFCSPSDLPKLGTTFIADFPPPAELGTSHRTKNAYNALFTGSQ